MSTRLFLGRDARNNNDIALKPDRLRTHAVVVGMTGSGKTGLCLVLLEELVRAKVPIIAIDPKGDLGNLGLIFPELKAGDFAPWCGQDDPQALATRWREGLGKWGLSEADVAGLRAQISLTVYTPGSEAGVPVNVLGSFDRPSEDLLQSDEARFELISDIVSGLLGLVGRTSDPVRDPAHVVLSQIIDQAWRAGEDPDLETLILRLVDPPFEKVGVFPLDRFFSPDERMKLAMLFNGVAASPSFAPWTKGATLDPEQFLRRDARTPVHIFNLAHLEESERQFFVSLLLGRVQAWSRSQPGTEDLRAVVFFDEVAGYMPPYPAKPPSKGPLLSLMKQARAVGLGVILATQNPVDLDYKALSNAGLWCIGRLSTPQDRERLLKGIQGEGLDSLVSGLNKREFLLHQVGASAPDVLSTRHAMCFLRGPFTRTEVPRVNQLHNVTAASTGTGGAAASTAASSGSAQGVAPEASDGLLPVPPTVGDGPRWFLDPRMVFSARMEGCFDPYALDPEPGGAICFRPALYAELQLRFDEDRAGFLLDQREHRVWFPLKDSVPEVHIKLRPESGDLSTVPPDGARFEPLPVWMDEKKELDALAKRVVDDVFRTETRGMFSSRKLKLSGRADETRAEFEARCRNAIEDQIDAETAKLTERYKTKIERLEDRLQAKQAKLVEQKGVARSRQLEEAVNLGSTLFSLFSGRKKSLTSTITKRRMSARSAQKASSLEAEIDRISQDAEELELELSEKIEEIRQEAETILEDIEEGEVRLEKSDIQLISFGILWVPVTRRI